MFKRTNRVAAGLVATAAASVTILSMTATGAQAATTYTPTGGPNANFVGSGVSFRDIEADQKLTCPTFNLTGSIISSGTSRAYGADAGSLTGLNAGGTGACNNPIAGATTVAPLTISGTTGWSVAITADATGTSWPARLKNVRAKVSAAGCEFTVTGVVNGRFDTSNQKFTPATGASGLTVDDGLPAGSGEIAPGTQPMCVTLDIQPGDTIEVAGSWTNTPPSGSTAIAIANP
ncbi:hypothetical protein GUY44_20710 [Pimelobacter simplex]|uniref:Uncharacterized protein n=1 Tax=Nocardioides simplex TaxID=2045 RepID=A0A0A1DGJ7_NOCSI|nr:hypothetical protein [Pimelobacter simplex]AIY16414.1 hypothetical protein KR76_05915 [Pimelobacter simplex]MCG8152916.1 hypothetical protein [Pimelobacter simplex]GEB11884.1 hypothetical protein NSI01_01990 [Pimelobacter simplex]SFN03019.1 hypothetical protein SAMN05421671_4744 [Pimelobacter simplex]